MTNREVNNERKKAARKRPQSGFWGGLDPYHSTDSKNPLGVIYESNGRYRMDFYDAKELHEWLTNSENVTIFMNLTLDALMECWEKSIEEYKFIQVTFKKNPKEKELSIDPMVIKTNTSKILDTIFHKALGIEAYEVCQRVNEIRSVLKNKKLLQ